MSAGTGALGGVGEKDLAAADASGVRGVPDGSGVRDGPDAPDGAGSGGGAGDLGPVSLPGRSVLAGAFALLDALAAADEAGLARLAAAAGLPKATAHRLLGQLAELGAVDKSLGRYRVGSRLAALSRSWRPDPVLLRSARPLMAALVRATGATVGLCVPHGDVTVLADMVPGPMVRWLATSMEPGMAWPSRLTAAGQTLIAWTEPELWGRRLERAMSAQQVADIRGEGVVLDRQGAAVGVCCASAPVLSGDGVLRGSVWAMATPDYPLDRLAAGVTRVGRAIGLTLAQREGGGPPA